MLRRLVGQVSTLADRALPAPAGVTVLIYHRVGGGSDSTVDLPVAEFRRQLTHLAAHHRIISLDDAVSGLLGDTPLEDRAVVLTFDDGTADFADHAVPALVDAGLPATLYLASGFTETGRPYPGGAPPVSWAALRDAVGTGLVTVGSHTHDHLTLHRADPAVARADLDRSVATIAERLGAAPAHFAYPKAVPPSAGVERLVRDRFRSAALAGNRVNTPERCDLHRLGRSPVKRGLTPDAFARLASGGGRLEGAVRAGIARTRYRTAAT